MGTTETMGEELTRKGEGCWVKGTYVGVRWKWRGLWVLLKKIFQASSPTERSLGKKKLSRTGEENSWPFQNEARIQKLG